MQARLNKVSDYLWELPVFYKKGMKVPIRIVASEKLVKQFEEVVFEQSANVASLPGLVDSVVILPDAHSGYGACIGTVFATDPKNNGIISPGAVGYDINCGMRLMLTNLHLDEIKPSLQKLVNLLFESVPAGLGGEGFLKVNDRELDGIMMDGAKFMTDHGFGWQEDIDYIEEKGKIENANPDKVSAKAKERGRRQLATLGSGNHYLEIQKVEEIFDPFKAKNFGIEQKGQIAIMFHCGSRGLGHQIATDYLRSFEKKLDKYHIKLDDLQLACVPFLSSDGQNYYQAMAAAANFAFANRQIITYRIREAFAKVFGRKEEDLGMKLVYDVAHNIAKLEKHQILSTKSQTNSNDKTCLPAGRSQTSKELVVHRKGATRSYPGQPVIIGGSMETGSYLLMGTEKSLELTFGSTAHGSGRTMSRHQARRIVRGDELKRKMTAEGIVVRSVSSSGLAEEAALAYKNIGDVIESVAKIGISQPVAAFKPIGNIKG